jgi:dihydrofolate reductase
VTIGIIAAVSPEGVIGIDGDIPWHYSADMKRFKRLTEGKTVIMGRRTWESLPVKPLKNRRNIVITGRDIEGVECFRDVAAALERTSGDVWFIGGARIYEEAMRHADLIDLTYVPDEIEADGAVHFPAIDESVWEPGPRERAADDDRLERQVFRRRALSPGTGSGTH